MATVERGRVGGGRVEEIIWRVLLHAATLTTAIALQTAFRVGVENFPWFDEWMMMPAAHWRVEMQMQRIVSKDMRFM